MHVLLLRWGAGARLAVSAGAGIVVWLVVALSVSQPMAVLCAIAATAGVFDVLCFLVLWPMSGSQTHEHARRETFRPIVEEFVVVCVAIASLVGIAVLLVVDDSGVRHVAATIALVGVFGTWAMLDATYAARYAHLYYTDPVGGIDFNDDEPPSYRDFFYFSYNLGMTYQVSDTDVSSTAIRVVALRHCLLSFVYGTVILAATINLVAGIVTR